MLWSGTARTFRRTEKQLASSTFVFLDGRAEPEGYAILGSASTIAIPSEFSVAFWLKPDAVTDDSYFFSRHSILGDNVFLSLGRQRGRYWHQLTAW